MIPLLQIEDLDAGNAPIIEFAAGLLAATDAETVTFQVQYAIGDQPRHDYWSEPDTITVNRAGEIVA